jgi:hypothetical protein
MVRFGRSALDFGVKGIAQINYPKRVELFEQRQLKPEVGQETTAKGWHRVRRKCGARDRELKEAMKAVESGRKVRASARKLKRFRNIRLVLRGNMDLWVERAGERRRVDEHTGL